MAKIYFKICAFILLFVGTIGWLLPFLFSAPSDFAVYAGFAVAVLGGYFFYRFGKNIIKDIASKVSKSKQN